MWIERLIQVLRSCIFIIRTKRELPFLRIPRVLLKGICRGKTESLSASKVTCIVVTMAWCVAGQGVVCNTVTLVNFHRCLWVMRSRCRMVHSWSMVRSCRLVHVSIV